MPYHRFLCLAAALFLVPLVLGQQPCFQCHAAETTAQVKTSMAHALTPAPISEVLKAHPHLQFRDGQTEYSIDSAADRAIYSVQRGTERFSAPIQWAFGAGNTGQTYVYLLGESLYEARVSFYRSLNGLEITTGHKGLPDTTIEEAAGRLLSENETTTCFGCHMSKAGSDFVPGVQCTACHVESEEHAASFKTQGKPLLPTKLHSLSSIELADVCGRCHRTFATVRDLGPKTVENVRFQPYRLVSSKCFDPDDARISCVACHNPHEEVRKTPRFYDSTCLACHTITATSIKHCPVAKTNCTTCHMPKIQLPEMHNTFTDHRIRVVRKGEAYPS